MESRIATLFDLPTAWVEETGWAFQGDQRLYGTHYGKTIRRAIRKRHFNCDAVGRDGDFSAYRVLVVSQLSPVDDALADKLVRYVKAGGTLVWHPCSGLKNMETAIYPERLHPALHELFGIDVREYATSTFKEPRPFTYRGDTYNGGWFYDLPVLRDAESLGSYAGNWFAGTPAVTVRKAGKGRAYYVATFAEERFYVDFLPALCEESGIEPVLKAPVNEKLEIAGRSAPDGRRFVFLLSYSDQEQTVELPASFEDIWNEERVPPHCVMPPYGVRILRAGEADSESAQKRGKS